MTFASFISWVGLVLAVLYVAGTFLMNVNSETGAVVYPWSNSLIFLSVAVVFFGLRMWMQW